MSILIRLKFTQNFAPYKEGDVAGFKNEADADIYLKATIDKKPVAKKTGRAKAVKSAPVDK